jgi:hypothetical protein
MNEGYPIPLSVDGLMAKAREITGVDIVDHDVAEPLTVMHRSLCGESRLHESGAVAQQNKLLRLLCNRLRMQRDFQRHPEIAEQKIEAPLIIFGMARSGTTKTQKILTTAGDFNWMPFWQTYNPALWTGDRAESPEARIRDADAYCRWFDESTPQTKLGHSFETYEPEEDTTLTEQCFRAPSFIGYAEIPSYLQWLATQSPLPLFEFLRDTLKYLQWQGLASPAKKWLLKAPTYYGMEPALLQVFPDAQLVMTHRSPLQTVPSSCKLVACFRVPFCDAPVDGAALTAGFGMMMDLHIANRKAHPEMRILDLSFEEIAESIDSVVEKIYAHARLPLRQEAQQRMRQWALENPMHKKGAFKYSLEEFGLNAELVTRAMGGYLAFTRQLFGK